MVKAASLEGPCFPPEFASWWGCCGHFNPMKIKKENCPFCEPRPQTSIPSTSHATDTGIVLDVGSAQLLGGSSGQEPWSSSSPYPMAWGKGCVCWLGSSELGQRQAMEVWAWEVPTLPRREAALVTCPVLLLSQISLTRWKKKITALQRGQGLGGARGEGRWESCCQLVGWLGVAWGRGRCRNLENSSSIWGSGWDELLSPCAAWTARWPSLCTSPGEGSPCHLSRSWVRPNVMYTKSTVRVTQAAMAGQGSLVPQEWNPVLERENHLSHLMLGGPA